MSGLAGALLVFCSCTAIGMYAAATYRKAADELEAFHGLIVHIGAQIDGFLMPLDEIFESYTDKVLEKNGFLPMLRREGIGAAMESVKDRLYMGEAGVAELENYFSGLGRHGAEEEARHSAYYEKRIAELAKTARDVLPAKSRLCRAFGVLSGIMLAVILL